MRWSAVLNLASFSFALHNAFTQCFPVFRIMATRRWRSKKHELRPSKVASNILQTPEQRSTAVCGVSVYSSGFKMKSPKSFPPTFPSQFCSVQQLLSSVLSTVSETTWKYQKQCPQCPLPSHLSQTMSPQYPSSASPSKNSSQMMSVKASASSQHARS